MRTMIASAAALLVFASIATAADVCDGVKPGTCAEYKAVAGSGSAKGGNHGADVVGTDPSQAIRSDLRRDAFAQRNG